MALLSELSALRARVAGSPGRLAKRRLVADYLSAHPGSTAVSLVGTPAGAFRPAEPTR